MAENADILTELNMFDDQVQVRTIARDYARSELKPFAARIDTEQKLPAIVWPRLAQLKLTGVNVALQYGGMGCGTLCAATAIEELARVCASTAVSLSTHLFLCAAPIARFGNEAQRARFLPLLAGGSAVGAFCMTEETSGCDAGGIKTHAEQKVNKLILNGKKKFIVNGAEAGLILVAASTDPKIGAAGITLLVVEAGTPGVAADTGAEKMGLRGAEWGEFEFTDAEIPMENMIGVREKGFGIIMEAQLGGRIGMGAVAVGLATAALEAAVHHAKNRKQFGKAIGAFESVANMVADMTARVEAARLLVYRAALRRDEGKSHVRESAVAKMVAAENCVRVCEDAVQIYGASGFEKNNPVERYYRAAKMLDVGEGTSQMLKLVIARDVMGKL